MGLAEDQARAITGLVCVGKETITVTSNVAVSLASVPNRSTSALIRVESDANSTDLTKSVRFWESGDAPTSSQGFSLGNLDVYEITNYQNISRAKFIGINPGETHTLQIMYYA